jgi:hypothetical protein
MDRLDEINGASRTGRPPVASLNSCDREISGERRSALAALLGTLPEQEPSKMRQVHEERYALSDRHVDRNLRPYLQCARSNLRIVGVVAADG